MGATVEIGWLNLEFQPFAINFSTFFAKRRHPSPPDWGRDSFVGGQSVGVLMCHSLSCLINYVGANMKLILGLLTGMLAGCATSVISTEKIQTYSKVSPSQFVKSRFYDAEKNTFNAITDSIDSIMKPLEGKVIQKRKMYISDSPTISLGGAMVAWTAYYTKANFIQLARPAIELKRFCEVQGAQMKILRPYDGDFLSDLKKNPVLAFVDAHRRVHKFLNSKQAFLDYPMAQESIATAVATEILGETLMLNKKVGAAFSEEALMYAQRLKVFGIFSCVDHNNIKMWNYSILPIYFEAADSNNQLVPASARIVIHVF